MIYEEESSERSDTGTKAVLEETSEAAYESWYEANFFYLALSNAADAVREESARAFKLGIDDVAFALREMAKELEHRARVEANEWEKARAPK